jgi:hypothetical protein
MPKEFAIVASLAMPGDTVDQLHKTTSDEVQQHLQKT